MERWLKPAKYEKNLAGFPLQTKPGQQSEPTTLSLRANANHYTPPYFDVEIVS